MEEEEKSKGRASGVGRVAGLVRLSAAAREPLFSLSSHLSLPPTQSFAMAGVESPLAPLTNGVGRTNGALNGNGDIHDSIAEPAISFDSSVFRSYLLSLLPPIFGASPEELESLFDEDFDDRCSRFAGEGGGVVYVVKKRDEQESQSLPLHPLFPY